jgi:hypothetical protein
MPKAFPNTGVTIVDNSSDIPAASASLEGFIVFQKDTNELKICDGTNWIGVVDTDAPNGLVLINPTSVAGSGVTLSNGTVTISAASSASVNGVFSSLFDNYRVIWSPSAYSNAAQTQTNIRLRVSGADNSNANYYWSRNFFGDGVGGGSSVNLGTVWQLGDTNTPLHYFTMDIYSPFLSRRTSFTAQTAAWQTATSVFFLINTAGTTSVTTSYDGFTLSASAGTFSGELRIYGYRNSI